MRSEGKKEILLGDCLELMKDIPNGSIDMILADLPYGTTECKWDCVLPFSSLWLQYNRIVKPNGAIVLFGREPFTSSLVMSNVKNYKHKWIWNKKQTGSFANAKYMPLQIDEDIVIFSNGKCNYYPIMRKGKMRKKGGSKGKNEIQVRLKQNHHTINDDYYHVNIYELVNPRTEKIHPTQKPIELFEYLIKTYSKEGEVVLDNTAGSGTTAIACLNTNRQFIVMEKEEKYYQLIKTRVNEQLRNNDY